MEQIKWPLNEWGVARMNKQNVHNETVICKTDNTLKKKKDIQNHPGTLSSNVSF